MDFLRGSVKRPVSLICSGSLVQVSGCLPEDPRDLKIVTPDHGQWFRKTHFMDSQLGSRGGLFELLYFMTIIIVPLFNQPKESCLVEQLGAARGARCLLSEQGRAAVEQELAG
jgi:hypothetical protein